MTSGSSFQRDDILGTQVITRDTGKRLGVVTQLWVDIDRREVVALGLRESMLSGVLSNIQQTMMLSSIQQVGDVILVADDSAVDDDIDIEGYTNLINCEVITETGELLGKVRGFKFNTTNGAIESLVISSLGIPQIPDQFVSTYELSIEEVVSSGPDRLIVFEGAEEKMTQLTVGFLERLGIGRAPWDRDDDYYVVPTPTSNQLGTGMPTAPPLNATTAAPARENTWDDDNWQEAAKPEPEPVYEGSNWGDEEEAYEEVAYAEQRMPEPKKAAQLEYEDAEVLGDAWQDDDNPKPYEPPKLELPQTERVAEYEEELDY